MSSHIHIISRTVTSCVLLLIQCCTIEVVLSAEEVVQCHMERSCVWRCVTPSDAMKGGAGAVLDLTGIGNVNGYPPRWSNLPSELDSYLYSYNPCYSFSQPDDLYTLVNTCQDVVVCQQSPPNQYNQHSYYNGGAQVTEEVRYRSDKELEVNYHDSRGVRSSRVVLSCSKDAKEPILTVRGEAKQGEPYEFVLTASSVCLQYDVAQGLSTGSLLCISFACLVVVYCVGGALILRYRYESSGLDLVPNRHFWGSTLPALVKDGGVYFASAVGGAYGRLRDRCRGYQQAPPF